MSFEFTENITLYMPNVDEQVKSLTEAVSSTAEGKKLVIELAAIHEGLTANYNMYTADQLEKSLGSWVQPYPKPIILNHDPTTDAVGRVMAARMDKESDGTPYIRLQVAVTDPGSVEKVMDERYLTGSVGGRTESATCSICNKEWANASMFNLPCKHERGKVYNGKLAYLQLGDISWKEYSFVNIPADQKSGLRSVTVGGSSENADNEEHGWVRSVKFYTVDMNQESIMELSESEAPKNVLSELTKKNAHATYLNVKGTFLTVSAFDYQEENEKSNFIQSDTTINNEQDGTAASDQHESISEEKNMSKLSTAEVEENILDVISTLSTDLASNDENENSETEEVAEDATEVVEGEESIDATETSEVTSEGEETVAETEESEEQLADEESIESPEEQADSADATATEEVHSEEAESESSELIELRTQIDSLREENVKLKKALHYTLAERVVDAKISAGLLESTDRVNALEDHSSRTPSSLADALRDLEKINRKVGNKKDQIFELQTKAFAAGNEGESEFVDNEIVQESASTERTPVEILEDLFVDRLMNRKQF